MNLVFRLNGQEMARQKLYSISYFPKEIENLRNQFQDQIMQPGAVSEFCIENVPSSINHFKPLKDNFKDTI